MENEAPRLGFVRGAAFLCPNLFRDTAKMVCHTAVNASDCDVLCVSIV
nr:MAG TPA: hypothetical protein [Caudoviricetes sp.]